MSAPACNIYSWLLAGFGQQCGSKGAATQVLEQATYLNTIQGKVNTGVHLDVEEVVWSATDACVGEEGGDLLDRLRGDRVATLLMHLLRSCFLQAQRFVEDSSTQLVREP